MSAKKQRTRRFRLRFYLILLVPILLVGAYIGYRILRPTTGRLGTDTVEGDMEFTGVIIRRENVAPSEDYHTIRYLVSEGDMVSGSQQVAYLYRKGYENQMSDIVSKEQQIYQQQITLLRLSSSDGMTVPDEVSDYNSRIEEVVNKMTQASLGKDGLDYIRLSEELDDLLTARQNLLRQIVPTDATLTASYQQLDALRSAFSAESILVNNSGNGYISFHLDGYENAMSIDSLTESQVRRVVSSPVSASYNAAGVYRIVDPNGFYVAFTVSASDSHRLIVGNTYELNVKYQNAEREVSEHVLHRPGHRRAARGQVRAVHPGDQPGCAAGVGESDHDLQHPFRRQRRVHPREGPLFQRRRALRVPQHRPGLSAHPGGDPRLRRGDGHHRGGGQEHPPEPGPEVPVSRRR